MSRSPALLIIAYLACGCVTLSSRTEPPSLLGWWFADPDNRRCVLGLNLREDQTYVLETMCFIKSTMAQSEEQVGVYSIDAFKLMLTPRLGVCPDPGAKTAQIDANLNIIRLAALAFHRDPKGSAGRSSINSEMHFIPGCFIDGKFHSRDQRSKT